MRVWVSSAATVVLAATLAGVPTSPGQAAPTTPTTTPRTLPALPDDPALGTLISGEVSYVGGTHVFTDYVYDDRGPNNDLLPGGDEPYPAKRHRLGTADLVQLQLGTTGAGALRVDALLRTMVKARNSVVGLGIDQDRDPATGAPSLPGDRWTASGGLGLERLVTLSTDGTGALWRWTSGGWRRAAALATDVDRKLNTVGVSVPGLRPGRARWDAVGVVGRQTAGSWVDGSLPIQDLSYLRAEDPTDIGALSVPQQLPQDNYQPYQDWDQADVLAGNLPASHAVATVRFGTRRDVEPPTRQGFNAFLYHSPVDVPEGIVGAERLFSSAYQPYGVWIPEKLPRKRPLVVFLHGSDQYQNVNVVYFNNPVDPAGIQPYHDLKAITIFPNGRTPQWGTPLADRDALDAIADAMAREPLRLDPDRVVVTGISSGGYGTYHLASRYPDRFTGAYSIVGGAGDPDVTPVENLTNVPFRASNGAADPLVDVSVWRDSADRLRDALTVDYRTVLIANGSHNGAVAEGACFLEDLISRDRVRNPARIRFRVPAPSLEVRRLGLQPRGAYWVSGLTFRRPEKTAYINAVSQARRKNVPREWIRETGQNAVTGADFCGPNPTLIRGQAWQTEGRRFSLGSTAGPDYRNRIHFKMLNLRTATLDLRRAGLDPERLVTLVVRNDGPTRLTLTGFGEPRVVDVKRGYQVLRLRF